VATTSSSVSLTVSWVEDGLTRSLSTTALAANTLAQYASGAFLIKSDPGVPVTYAITYASVGATPMHYALDLYTERLP
jgi:hypothetical protein